MAIYRGPGGSGDATNDATSQSIIATQAAIEAAEAAIQAAASAVSASNSATAASNSESAASTSATNASNFADDAADYATAAASALDEFTDLYLGAKTTNPSLDNDGNALQTGALYFNTVANEFRVYTGIEWQVITVGAVGDSVITQRFSGDGNTVAFTLSTEPFSENSTFVYINGAYQQKNTYNVSGLTLTFSEAPPSGTDNIEVLTITMVDIDTITASIININDAGDYYASSKVEGALQEAATFTQSGTGAVLRTKIDKLKETVSIEDFGATSGADTAEINNAIAYAISSGNRVLFPFAATIRVPEDAPTIQDALDSAYVEPFSNVKITVQISSGHALTKGVVLVDVDYGNYKITSVDSVVYLAPSFSAVAPTSGVGAQNSIFYARRSKLPDIYCLFDMQSNFGSGVYLQEQSSGFISVNCGVKNAGHYGLLVSVQSAAVATQANFMGAAGGNAVTTGSFLTAPQANFSYAGGKPGADTAACLDVSRGSVVYITGQPGAETNLTHGLKRGLAVRRSFVSAAYIDVSNSGEFGYRIERGAWVNAYFGILNDVGIIAAYVDKSHLSMNGCVISNAGQYGIYGQHGADIIATDVQISNTTDYAAYVLRGSSIEMFQAVIDDTDGVYITQGSKANLERANITNTAGAIGRALRCQEGSNVNAADAVFGASTNESIFISEGSFVNAVGATTKSGSTGVAVVGDTNVSAFNTIDGNKGVIWN